MQQAPACLLEFDGKRLLLECGLYRGAARSNERTQLAYDPRGVDAMVCPTLNRSTPNVPSLVQQGFRGNLLHAGHAGSCAASCSEARAHPEADAEFIQPEAPA